jgi:GntR family transcriptional regulator, rspAB operon transcriptional repressor
MVMNFPEKIKGENSKEYAYRALKDNIMSLELKPGQNINESEISQQLNISRTPVREILMRLKEEHLIMVRPQIGTYVSLIDRQLVDEAFFMRYHLEKEVLRMACRNFPEESLMELEKNLVSQKRIFGKQDKELEFHKLDIEFHGLIFTGLNLPEVWNSILKISTHYNRLRLLFEIKFSNQDLIEHHEQFFNAIKDRDTEAVEILLEKHFNRPKESWKNLFNDLSEYRHYFSM